MQIGEVIELTIDSLAYGGEGIARRGGMVFFVENALPGEKVKARVQSIRKKFVRAAVLSILEPSPDRVEPFCPYFGTCGGCAFQHLRYERQLADKRKMVEDTLRHLGGLRRVEVEPTIGSPKPLNYRNHITFNIEETRRQLRFGFVAKDNQTLLEVESCPIADTRINFLFPAIRERFGKLPPTLKSRVRKIIVRVGSEGKAKFELIEKGTRFDHPEAPFMTWVEGMPFQFSMESFFQTNYFILPRLIRLIREMLHPESNSMLLDLYAGVGFFSALFAKDYREIIAVEEGRGAVRDARLNLEMNKAANVRIMGGKVEEVLRNIRSKLTPPIHILMDPPRIGAARPVIDFLCNIPVERLVYVSCEPSILARDLRQLSRAFKIKRVVPLDMFPQTKHIETLVLAEPH